MPDLWNEEAERALLGDMLLDPSIVAQVAVRVQETMLTVRNRRIFSVACKLGERLDLVSLVDAMKGDDETAVYLARLPDATPTSVMWETHADILIRLTQARQLRDAGERMVALSGNEDPATLLEWTERVIGDIRRRSVALTGKGPMLLKDILPEVMVELESIWEARAQGKEIGVPFPFPAIQRGTGGQRAGEVILVKGPTGSGKSLFIAQCAIEATKVGHALLCTNEMMRADYAQRLIARFARVDALHLRSEVPTDDELGRITKSLGALSEFRLSIQDECFTVAEFKSALEQARDLYGELAWVALDWLQNLDGGKSDSRTQELDEYMRGLNRLSKQYRLPIMVGAQIDKIATRSGRSGLGSLRGSAGPEQVANQVIDIQFDKDAPPVPEHQDQPYRLVVTKSRMGTHPVEKVLQCGRFGEFRLRSMFAQEEPAA